MAYKSLGCFEFSMSLFLIFKNNIQTLNILLLLLLLLHLTSLICRFTKQP
jgi:hypothetical protein